MKSSFGQDQSLDDQAKTGLRSPLVPAAGGGLALRYRLIPLLRDALIAVLGLFLCLLILYLNFGRSSWAWLVVIIFVVTAFYLLRTLHRLGMRVWLEPERLRLATFFTPQARIYPWADLHDFRLRSYGGHRAARTAVLRATLVFSGRRLCFEGELAQFASLLAVASRAAAANACPLDDCTQNNLSAFDLKREPLP